MKGDNAITFLASSPRLTPVEQAVLARAVHEGLTVSLMALPRHVGGRPQARMRVASLLREITYPATLKRRREPPAPRWSDFDLTRMQHASEVGLLVDCRWDHRAVAAATSLQAPWIQLRISSSEWRTWGRMEVLAGQGWCPLRIVASSGHDPEEIVRQGAFATRWSPHSTAKSIAARAGLLMADAVVQFLRGEASAQVPDPATRPNPPAVRGLASVMSTVQVAIRMPFTERARRAAPWHLGVTTGGFQQAELAEGRPLSNPVGGWLADPHWCSWQGVEGLFVEQWDYANGRGHIAWMPWNEGRGGPTQTVVIEDCHLSFPFTFEFSGRLYMTVESAEDRCVRVYECLEFPSSWRRCWQAMTGVEAVDPVIVQGQHGWYLLVNYDSLDASEPGNELHVFFAHDPRTSDWQPVPGNPQVVDPRCARNGGLFIRGGQMYRVAQRHGFRTYGQSCTVMHVQQMDPRGYRERPVREFDLGEGRGPHTITGNDELTIFDVHDVAE